MTVTFTVDPGQWRSPIPSIHTTIHHGPGGQRSGANGRHGEESRADAGASQRHLPGGRLVGGCPAGGGWNRGWSFFFPGEFMIFVWKSSLYLAYHEFWAIISIELDRYM